MPQPGKAPVLALHYPGVGRPVIMQDADDVRAGQAVTLRMVAGDRDRPADC